MKDPAEESDLLWRQETVAKKLDVSVRTLERWRATRDFPKPDLKLTTKAIFWKPETVQAWLDKQLAAAVG